MGRICRLGPPFPPLSIVYYPRTVHSSTVPYESLPEPSNWPRLLNSPVNDCENNRLFPMPLATFERYMWADDWRPYPADGFLCLTFRGRLRHDVFEDALQAALARHPLMQAWIRQDSRGRPVWVEAVHRRPFITWDPQIRPPQCPLGPTIDLRREIGARFFLTEDGERTNMLMQMHHTCCDGLALVQIAEDVLIEYQRRVAGASAAPQLRPLDAQRLHRRGHFGLGWLGLLRRVPLDLAAGLAAFEYFGHRPVPIGPPTLPPQDAGVPDNYPALASHTLTLEETDRLRAAAKQHRVTVNDLLLCDLFMALQSVLAAADPENARRIVRIMVPMNLRVSGDEATPAANLVSMTYLDRRPTRFPDAGKLLRSIHREMRLLKAVRAGITLIRGIQVAERLPGGLRTILPYDRCLATAVLSNMGVAERVMRCAQTDGLYRAGDAILESISAAPPLRPLTRASFITISYAGRLTITLQYDSHVMNAMEGRSLLDRFVEQIRQR